jgi:hypothetical protein
MAESLKKPTLCRLVAAVELDDHLAMAHSVKCLRALGGQEQALLPHLPPTAVAVAQAGEDEFSRTLSSESRSNSGLSQPP